MLVPETYTTLADAYAFIGNSLLKPMTMTSPLGLDPAFWADFPDFGDGEVERCLEALVQWAEAIDVDQEQAVQDVSVEYTKLFVGPGTPAAVPWETMYKGEEGAEVTVGFGTPTFQMRQLLREIGLELSNENRQYEDHMGIELLYLSELCRRAADASPDEEATAAGRITTFITEHPLSWIDGLTQKANDTFPNSYIPLLLELAKSLMKMTLNHI